MMPAVVRTDTSAQPSSRARIVSSRTRIIEKRRFKSIGGRALADKRSSHLEAWEGIRHAGRRPGLEPREALEEAAFLAVSLRSQSSGGRAPPCSPTRAGGCNEPP